MNKKLLILPLICSFLTAKTIQPEVMHAQDSNHQRHYEQSIPNESTEDRVISSTAEASAQITVMVTLQTTSEVTSGRHTGTASMSFLNNNRIEITNDIARGEGEYLETLLTMMELKKDKKSLERIQHHFNELIYLGENDFLDKLENLV